MDDYTKARRLDVIRNINNLVNNNGFEGFLTVKLIELGVEELKELNYEQLNNLNVVVIKAIFGEFKDAAPIDYYETLDEEGKAKYFEMMQNSGALD